MCHSSLELDPRGIARVCTLHPSKFPILLLVVYYLLYLFNKDLHHTKLQPYVVLFAKTQIVSHS